MALSSLIDKERIKRCLARNGIEQSGTNSCVISIRAFPHKLVRMALRKYILFRKKRSFFRLREN